MSAVELWAEEEAVLARLSAAERVLLCFDYDGTLAPIVSNPDRAWPAPGAAEMLVELEAAPRTTAAIVTGRALDDLGRVLGYDGVWRVGRHGLESAAPGAAPRPLPELDLEGLRRTLDQIRPAAQALAEAHAGARLEDKVLGLAFHTRALEEAEERVAQAGFRALARHLSGFDLLAGKRVLELRPSGVDKGRAIIGLREAIAPGAVVFYAGDDTTDEDAFARLSGDAITVRVADPGSEAARTTKARYLVGSPEEVVRLGERIAEVRARGR